MRISIVACRIFNRELSALAAASSHCVELHWLPQGLHNVPKQLNERLGEELHRIYEDVKSGRTKHKPDYIVLAYGLCSNGVIGLESEDIPIIVPRTDDCIALLLGSQAKYMDVFNQMPGTYWLSSGWIEACGTLVDNERFTRQRWQMYAQKYDEETADYLIEQETSWARTYSHCGYIGFDHISDHGFRQQARRTASENNWTLCEFQGDLRMLEMMVDGSWNEDEFLICPPYHRIEADYGGQKIKAVPLE